MDKLKLCIHIWNSTSLANNSTRISPSPTRGSTKFFHSSLTKMQDVEISKKEVTLLSKDLKPLAITKKIQYFLWHQRLHQPIKDLVSGKGLCTTTLHWLQWDVCTDREDNDCRWPSRRTPWNGMVIKSTWRITTHTWRKWPNCVS